MLRQCDHSPRESKVHVKTHCFSMSQQKHVAESTIGRPSESSRDQVTRKVDGLQTRRETRETKEAVNPRQNRHGCMPPDLSPKVTPEKQRRQQQYKQQPIGIHIYRNVCTPLPAHAGNPNPCNWIGGPGRAIAVAKHACTHNATSNPDNWILDLTTRTQTICTCRGVTAS